MEVNIVWFKKDLRLEDNKPLFLAYNDNLPTILLYIIEPKLWKQEDVSFRQFTFLRQCLQDLKKKCQIYDLYFNILTGETLEIFNYLTTKFTIKKIYSHQETGNYWTYNRDKEVRKWCKTKNIIFSETRQHGVIRGLKDRDGWSKKWYQQMSQENYPITKDLNTVKIDNEKLVNAEELGLVHDNICNAQIGGRENGINFLNSFLYQRGENYSKEMSSPVTAFNSCSRISPYLTFGCISIKEVFKYTSQRQQELKTLSPKDRGKWLTAIRSFLGRLRWHCHFMQKLEDDPNIEFKNLHSAYDNLDRNNNPKYLKAWQEGKTGFPMVDAAMRALIKCGWINFRMRAMLVSFASHHLWLDWRITSKYLARLFIDYEAGIHYSQIQMQSGTTGINAIRIYNPTKQARDHDPNGIFIREYIPELEYVSNHNIATPYNEALLVKNYPMPIIDEAKHRKTAATKLYNLRKNIAHKIESDNIVRKHGSRKSGLKRTSKKF